MRIPLLLCGFLILFSCKEERTENTTESSESVDGQTIAVRYAKGFTINETKNGYTITIAGLGTETNVKQQFALTRQVNSDINAQQVPIPLQRVIATSTTHVPMLDELQVLETLVGFPGSDYVSNETFRTRADAGQISELGSNESMDTERVIALQPDAILSFTVNAERGDNSAFAKAGIPQIQLGGWTETHPLGRLEWILVVGALYDKLDEAQAYFDKAARRYQSLAAQKKDAVAGSRVLSGGLFQDVWYAPRGNSWMAQLLKDAGMSYVWKNTEGTGSLNLSFEDALIAGKEAQVWIGPGSYTSAEKMTNDFSGYAQFASFPDNVWTFSRRVGATGGLLYYETAPMHPDQILEDMIEIRDNTKRDSLNFFDRL